MVYKYMVFLAKKNNSKKQFCCRPCLRRDDVSHQQMSTKTTFKSYRTGKTFKTIPQLNCKSSYLINS